MLATSPTMDRPVYAASALFAGFRFEPAVTAIHAGVTESFGAVSADHIQLCPQHHGILDDETVDGLMARFPTTQFRLHANVRTETRHCRFDASSGTEADAYFSRLGELSERLRAPGYTLHAGRSSNATLDQAFDKTRKLTDLFQLPVGIEGLYPERQSGWLLATWTDYARLMSEDVYDAIDLSHLNIVARCAGFAELGLTRELLANPRCIEIHISDNDGHQDAHRIIAHHTNLWWWPALSSAHAEAKIFSEGVQAMMGPNGPKQPPTPKTRWKPIIRHTPHTHQGA